MSRSAVQLGLIFPHFITLWNDEIKHKYSAMMH